MKRVALFVLCLAVLLPAGLFAEESVAGVWKCVGKSEGRPPREFKLDLVQKGKEVTGTASRDDGSAPISKGSFEDNKLKLSIDVGGGNVIELEGKLENGKLSGEIPAPTGKVTWEGVREGGAAPAPSASSPASGDIVGSWKIQAKAGDRTNEYTVDFKREGDKLTGKITGPDGGSLDLTKVTFAGNVLKFTVPADEGTYEVEGMLEAGKLSGTYLAPNGHKDTWQAARL